MNDLFSGHMTHNIVSNTFVVVLWEFFFKKVIFVLNNLKGFSMHAARFSTHYR